MKNKFIVLEGLDGSGKTTIAARIVEYLRNRGITNILTTCEPGGTPVANVLRMLIKYNSNDESIGNVSELLMIYAARLQLLEHVIKPALLKGFWVIGDRYDLSSQAYQGGGRRVDKLLLRILSRKITSCLSPDLTLYLDIPPKISALRLKNRGMLDRIERESLSFFNRVRSRYQELAASQENIITINANQNLKRVIVTVFQYLDWWLLSVQNE